MNKGWLKLIAPLFAIALIAAACGGSDSDSESSDSSDTESSTETETETTEAPETEDTVLEAGTEAEGDVDTKVEEVVEESSYGGDVIIGLEAEATGLRPWEDACSSPCLVIMKSMIDTMVERRADGTYGPWLATSWSSNDGYTEWTFELQEGVLFHNGYSFSAQTLVDMFELQSVGAVSAGVISAAKVAEVVAVDDLTVKYVLSGAHSAFPSFLYGVGLGGVFEPHAANEDFDGFAMNPVGTGPFMMDKRDLDNETIVVRNPNYWMSDKEGNQLPYLDSVAFRPIPDEGTRLDSLLSGTTSMMQTLRQGTIRDARSAKEDGADITLLEFQGNNVGGGQYNNNNPPLDDVRVRKGLTQMNNQDAVIEALGGTGISLPGTQWFSPDSPWYSEKVAAAWPKFDYEAGKALIEEYVNDPDRSDGRDAGDNIEVELSCPPDPTLIAAIQVIEQLWSATGMIDVNVTNYDQQTHINYALGAPPDFMGEHGAHCWRWSSNDDPSTFLNTQFAPHTLGVAAAYGLDGIFSPINFPNYFDIEMFGWLAAAIATDVFEERYALYEMVMMRLARDVPVWYSGHTATLLAAESNILGVNGWVLPDGTLGAGFPSAVARWGQVFIDD